MNCLEFRRHVGAEPSSTPAAVAAHREECPTCAGFHDEMQALDRLLTGRTAVIIAHRLQTTMRADRIVVVADGGVAEVGTRDELLAADGHFARMWETGGLT